MSQSTAKSLRSNEAQPFYEEASSVAPLRQRPGRVVHDARGTATWDWSTATEVPGITTATGVQRLLEAPALEIERERDPAGDWAGDPYNRGR